MTPTPNLDHIFIAIDPASATNGQLLMAMQAVYQQNQTTSAALLQLTREFAEYKKQHEEMVDTWKAGKTLLSVIKVLGGTAVALGALYAAGRALFNH